MADSTPIQYADAIDPSLMPTFIAQAKEAITLLGQLEEGFKATLKASTLKGSPLTASDYKKQAEDIKKANEAFTGLNETQKKSKTINEALTVAEQAYRLQKAQTNKETKAEAQLLIAQKGSYNDLVAQLAKLDIAYKNINLSNKNMTEQEKAIINNRAKLKQQLIDLDATQNVYTRNVGNYTGALVKLGRGFGGLTELLGQLGGALGIDTEAFDELNNVGKSLIKTSKELHHTLELQELAHEANEKSIKGETASKILDTEATEAQTVADEAEAAASEASLGVFGLIGVAIGLVTLGVWSLIDSKREDIYYTKEETKALLEWLDASKEKRDFDKAVEDAKKLQGGDEAQKNLNEEVKKLYEKLDAEKEIGGQEIDQMRRIEEQMKARGDSEESIFAQSQKIKKAELAQLQQRQKDLGIYASGDLKLQKDIADKKNEIFVEQLSYEKKIHDEEEKDLAAWAKKMEEIYWSVYQKDFDKPDEAKLKKLEVNLSAGNEEVDKRIAEDKKLKELDDKKTEDELNNIHKVVDAVGRGLEERNQMQMDALKIQSDQIESELSVQENLFKDGLDNTLAYDEKAKAENTEKELQAQRKAAKQKKAVELGNTYIGFLQSFLKDGSNPESAAVKALASTLVSEGIADAIAGSAFDGIEDTGSRADGGLDGKGGKLWIVHPNERIVPKNINDKLAGISNEELGNMFDPNFNALYRPNFLASIPNDSIGGKGSVDMTTLMELNGKMIRDGIEKGFSKIQVTNYDLNVYGKIVETHTSNGISKTYVHQSDVFK